MIPFESQNTAVMIFPAEKIALAFFGGWRMGVFALLACSF
jgi:hypothetical protein